MGTSIEQQLLHSLDLPQGVSAALDDRTLTVRGPLGSVKKAFERIIVDLEVEGNRVNLRPFTKKKKDVVTANTAHSLVRNMVVGVTQGFTYKLKVVYAHFPVSVKFKEGVVVIENFMGERSPRTATIIGDCKVTAEGDDIIIKGVSVEDVGQTAANIEHATRVKRKDQRIFLDGIYIYEKKRGWQ